MLYRPINSHADFNELVKLGATAESRFLEFKREYQWAGTGGPAKREVALELCRDVAQFANTDGGVLVVGIAERTEADGTSVATGIVPVVGVDGFVAWAEQAIRNHLVPSTFKKDIVTVQTAIGPIVALNVPPYIHLVALWPNGERRGIEYLYRTTREKAWMNPDEVETHLMDGSRAIKLEAKRIFAATAAPRNVELVPPVSHRRITQTSGYALSDLVVPDRDAAPRLREACEDYLVLTMTPSPVLLHIPYALVRSIWATADGSIGIALSARVFNTSEQGRQFIVEAL